MVDFVPGSTTNPASAGKLEPGGTITTSTAGSTFSGSRSSKLAIRGSIGTATTSAFFSPRVARSRITESSAGNRETAFNHRTTPKERQPVNCVIAASPSSKSETSPRNLLMRKPRTMAQSSSGRIVWVPTSEAITPPLSISPTRITGTSA